MFLLCWIICSRQQATSNKQASHEGAKARKAQKGERKFGNKQQAASNRQESREERMGERTNGQNKEQGTGRQAVKIMIS
ncbi:MAG: hypothetical protein LBL13_07415, partial [Bacteroidales bacterium]|nr:hypothetical protein [Bacteroidales bacterium]